MKASNMSHQDENHLRATILYMGSERGAGYDEHYDWMSALDQIYPVTYGYRFMGEERGMRA